MTISDGFPSLVALSFLLAASCSSDPSPEANVTLELTVLDFSPTTFYPPVSGAEVCLRGTDSCAETDGTGLAVLEVPAESEIAVTITKDGYLPALSPQTTGTETLQRETLALTLALAETLGAVLDTPIPPDGTGAISLTALDVPTLNGANGIDGATWSIMDSTGKRFYFEGQVPSLDAEATTTPLGSGGFVELPPGEYDVELGGSAADCEVLSGWAGGAAGTTLAPVEEGHLTFVYLICEPT